MLRRLPAASDRAFRLLSVSGRAAAAAPSFSPASLQLDNAIVMACTSHVSLRTMHSSSSSSSSWRPMLLALLRPGLAAGGLHAPVAANRGAAAGCVLPCSAVGPSIHPSACSLLSPTACLSSMSHAGAPASRAASRPQVRAHAAGAGGADRDGFDGFEGPRSSTGRGGSSKPRSGPGAGSRPSTGAGASTGSRAGKPAGSRVSSTAPAAPGPDSPAITSQAPARVKVGSGGGQAKPTVPPAPKLSAEEYEAAYAAAVAAFGLSEQQQQQLDKYLDYMLEVNQTMNLTAVRNKPEARVRHLADSLALLPIIESHVAAAVAAGGGVRGRGDGDGEEEGRFDPSAAPAKSSWLDAMGSMPAPAADTPGQAKASSKGRAAGPGAGRRGSGKAFAHGGPLRIIDVGTGAGLPGMVLAIARPQWKITLLDTLNKRCEFLKRAAQVAGVSNVDVVWARAEEGGRKPELRDAHDLAVARAVADTRVLAELCLPFVAPGGLWVAAKGPEIEGEVAAAAAAIKQLAGTPAVVEQVQNFSNDGQRTAVVVRKTARTPAKFPRPPGTPNKQPL